MSAFATTVDTIRRDLAHRADRLTEQSAELRHDAPRAHHPETLLARADVLTARAQEARAIAQQLAGALAALPIQREGADNG